MDWIGLTGGIATGKSTAGKYFANLGVAVVDADVLAREAVAPGSPVLAQIVEHFGEAFVDDKGLIREKMGAYVFSQPDELKVLNKIVHPEVARLAMERAQSIEDEGAERFIYEVPLLFEGGLQVFMKHTLVVACSAQTQLARVMARDGLSQEAAQARIDSQMPMDEKRSLADFVVENDGTLEEFEAQLQKIWRRICDAT